MADRVMTAVRSHGPSTLLPLLGAALAAHRGRGDAAIALIVGAVVLLVARVASRGRVDAVIAAGARWVGALFSAIALGLVSVAVVWPVWAVGRALRTRPLGPSGWQERTDNVPATAGARPFGADPARVASISQRIASFGLLAIGSVVLLLAVNLGLGLAFDVNADADSSPGREALRPDTNLHDAVLGPVSAADAGYAGASWAADQEADLRSLDLEYSSFVVWHVGPHDGVTMSTDGWVRRSVSLVPAGVAAPTVALFGGSLAFGVGQRDEHTVASEVSRLASADGLAIGVENRAQPGWSTWQSWIGFEQATAQGATPDLAVFLTGAEDGSIDGPAAGVVSHPEFRLIRDAVESAPPPAALRLDRTSYEPPPRPSWRILADAYWSHSISRRFTAPLPRKSGPSARVGPAMVRPEPVVAASISQAASFVTRARHLVRAIAPARGVDVVFAVQPVPATDARARSLGRAVAAGALDLSRLLDAEPHAFLADGSVGEAGARRIAAALWKRVRPLVQDWYDAHR